MKSSTTNNYPKPKNRHFPKTLLVIVLPTALLAWLSYTTYQFFTVDYARQTAQPIEDALIQAGAKKVCTRGSNGKDISNKTPWYVADYTIAKNHDDTEALINSIASKTGYTLTSPDSNQTIPQLQATKVDYVDVSSKDAPYNDLKPGKIGIAFTLYNDGPHEFSSLNCGTSNPVTIQSSASDSMIELQVVLPEYK